jgi:hypothetical protein
VLAPTAADGPTYPAHRFTSDLYHDDPLEYFQARDLLGLTHRIRVAADEPH